jgi:hypothetical protein
VSASVPLPDSYAQKRTWARREAGNLHRRFLFWLGLN